MENTIRGRLEALKSDFAAGERELTALEQRAAGVRQTLLRMSGAIQVLEELLVGEDLATQEKSPLEAVR